MKPRIVFLRGGGLGDFILTLPLLQVAYLRQHPVHIYARSFYLKLLTKEWDWLEREDLDGLAGKVPAEVKDSIAISFWTDPAWSKEMVQAGATAAHCLSPRPNGGKHFVIQACEKLGWEIPPGLLAQSCLGDCWRGKDHTLWIHPGSGGAEKKLPLVHFVSQAQKWLGLHEEKCVIFSFGEADKEVFEQFKAEPISKNKRILIRQPETTWDLRKQLVSEADRFLGNDSGPGHLAANLGIPVAIGYCKTQAMVWQPTGPRVTTYLWDSDSSKIL